MHNPSRCRRPTPMRNLLIAALAASLGLGTPIAAALASTHPAARAAVAPRQFAAVLAQEDDSDEDTEVSSDQIEKYVAVYKAMQRNRSLTVAQAAAKVGLTLSEFRDLEQKVGHDDLATERARNELQADAVQSSSPVSTGVPAKN
jgi:hypothetical protein